MIEKCLSIRMGGGEEGVEEAGAVEEEEGRSILSRGSRGRR